MQNFGLDQSWYFKKMRKKKKNCWDKIIWGQWGGGDTEGDNFWIWNLLLKQEWRSSRRPVPRGAAGTVAPHTGNITTLTWHPAPKALVALFSLCPPWSAFLHKSPSNTSVRKQIGPNWEFKIFPLCFKSHLLVEKGHFWAQNVSWDALSRYLSQAEPDLEDLQCFLGKREKWMTWWITPCGATEPTCLWPTLSLERGWSNSVRVIPAPLLSSWKSPLAYKVPILSLYLYKYREDKAEIKVPCYLFSLA